MHRFTLAMCASTWPQLSVSSRSLAPTCNHSNAHSTQEGAGCLGMRYCKQSVRSHPRNTQSASCSHLTRDSKTARASTAHMCPAGCPPLLGRAWDGSGQSRTAAARAAQAAAAWPKAERIAGIASRHACRCRVASRNSRPAHHATNHAMPPRPPRKQDEDCWQARMLALRKIQSSSRSLWVQL